MMLLPICDVWGPCTVLEIVWGNRGSGRSNTVGVIITQDQEIPSNHAMPLLRSVQNGKYARKWILLGCQNYGWILQNRKTCMKQRSIVMLAMRCRTSLAFACRKCCGAMGYYDKTFDRAAMKLEIPLVGINRVFHKVTTSDDPVIQKVCCLTGVRLNPTLQRIVWKLSYLLHLTASQPIRRLIKRLTSSFHLCWYVKYDL